jgi:PAS domain S-box-containing protein
MVFIAREDGIEYMNATGLKMLGLDSLDAIIGKTAFTFIAPQYHEEIRQRVVELYISGGTAPTYEEEIIRADGSTLDVEVIASLFTDAKGRAIQVIMQDISERKASDARREALGREISNASEREQRRIGQDLHDDICQRLAAVKMSMQDLEESLAEHAPALMDEADAIVDRLTDTIGITRSLARGLSPVDIEAGGLGVALTGLARTAREVHGIDCLVQMPDDLRPLPSHVATQFYRIAQECINNAAKHGKPFKIRVQLTEDNDALTLRVTNDGRTFTPGTDSAHGMGLHIMRHRAQSMGATLEFETQPADATVAVRCSLPLTAITKSHQPS